MSPARVVVVGAGFAGLNVVKGLRGRSDVEITVLERTNHHLFQALLYQVATAGLNPSEIASPVRAVFRSQANVSVIMGSLTGVDYANQTVETDSGRMHLAYDYLVLALGVKAGYFGRPEWSRYATPLKTLKDALHIRQKVLRAFEQAETETDPEVIERLTTIVVVGGGPTGVELSGAFAELCRHVLRWDFRKIKPERARVVLIEGGPRLLSVFPEKLSAQALTQLRRLGVEVHVGERVIEIEPGRVVTGGREIAAENVVWATGVEAHSLVSRLSPDQDRAGRLRILPDLRLPGRETVYCLGDMARLDHQGQPLPGMAPVAIQQGRHAAVNITRQLDGLAPTPFRYSDPGHVATIGRSAAVAKIGGFEFSGTPAWLAWLFTHLLRIVDYQNRLLVLARWSWAYLGWKWGVRLITEDPEGEER